MRFHPSLSIILGVIASFILYIISVLGFGTFGAFIQFFSYIFGGFIAVFYAREKKIRYALYEGIFIMLIINLPFLFSPDVIIAFFYGVLIILLAVIGGITGLMIDKNYRQSIKTKYLDKGFNLIAITTGIIITFVIWLFVFVIIYSIFHLNPSIFMDLIETTVLIGISVIGGFVATFMVKEKQLLNGFCVGLGIILIGIVQNVYAIIEGHPSPYLSAPLITIFATLGYILAPTIGSYLAIVATNRKQNTVTIK